MEKLKWYPAEHEGMISFSWFSQQIKTMYTKVQYYKECSKYRYLIILAG